MGPEEKGMEYLEAAFVVGVLIFIVVKYRNRDRSGGGSGGGGAGGDVGNIDPH